MFSVFSCVVFCFSVENRKKTVDPVTSKKSPLASTFMTDTFFSLNPISHPSFSLVFAINEDIKSTIFMAEKT